MEKRNKNIIVFKNKLLKVENKELWKKSQN